METTQIEVVCPPENICAVVACRVRTKRCLSQTGKSSVRTKRTCLMKLYVHAVLKQMRTNNTGKDMVRSERNGAIEYATQNQETTQTHWWRPKK